MADEQDPRKGEDGAAVDMWTVTFNTATPAIVACHCSTCDPYEGVSAPRRTLARALRALASWCDRVALRVLR
jgi:hypothetical protein